MLDPATTNYFHLARLHNLMNNLAHVGILHLLVELLKKAYLSPCEPLMRVRGQLHKNIIENVADLALIVLLHGINPSRIRV